MSRDAFAPGLRPNESGCCIIVPVPSGTHPGSPEIDFLAYWTMLSYGLGVPLMRLQMLVRSNTVLMSLFIAAAMSGTSCAGADVSALDLVSSDAAFCVEIPHFNQTWALFENGPLMERLRAVPAWQRLLDSRGFQHWQMIDDHVARQTGQKLSVQLRALVGRSLVLAVYVPADGPPRGILIGEAIDRSAVETAIATWNKLEPNNSISSKTHNGVRYQQRRKQESDAQNLFVATFDRWFAVSDQEFLVQDVIDRFAGASGSSPTTIATESLGHSKSFLRNMQRLKPGSVAHLYINARPWDRGLEEASRDKRDSINPAAIWKHVSALSACLHFDQGLMCEAVVELETSRLPSEWSQFVATAAADPEWLHRIPSDALLAIGGHVELAPVMRFLVSQVPPRDQPELAKNRRIAQSLLGGHELLDSVLPVLARDFCAWVVPRKDDRSKRTVLDGAVQFVANGPGDAQLLRDISRGLETGLNILAAFFSAQGPSVVTVQRQQSESTELRWLSESAPLPFGFGLNADNLIVASSAERLRQTFDPLSRNHSYARLIEHSQRFFPKANQLIWLDTAHTRELIRQNGSDIAQLFAHGSAEESARMVKRFEQLQPALGLVDSLFIAGNTESDHIRVTFGGGLDAR